MLDLVFLEGIIISGEVEVTREQSQLESTCWKVGLGQMGEGCKDENSVPTSARSPSKSAVGEV